LLLRSKGSSFWAQYCEYGEHWERIYS
jgi:hypothetical protein